jgi:hypothetical protein
MKPKQQVTLWHHWDKRAELHQQLLTLQFLPVLRGL